MEATVATGLEKEQKGERFTLIDPPLLPEKPFKPNRLAIVLIGIVLGIGAGVGFAALREFGDDSVRSPEMLEAATSLPVLTGIPVLRSKHEITLTRWRRAGWAMGTAFLVAASVVIFHFYVMDLNIFWVKLMRRLAI
jgi:hypothetical protein